MPSLLLLIVQFKVSHALLQRRLPPKHLLPPIRHRTSNSLQFQPPLRLCVRLSFGVTQKQVFICATHVAFPCPVFSSMHTIDFAGTLERTPWWGKDPVEEDIMPRCRDFLRKLH